MVKKVLKIIVIICVLVGVVLGIQLTLKKARPELAQKEIDEKIFSHFQSRNAEITAFYTYGRSLDIAGKIANVSEDNFENIRLVISDGEDYEKMYKMNTSFDKDTLLFSSDEEINQTILIDALENKEYYIYMRLKLNNSVEPRYYSFTNISEYSDITYYTLTQDGKNRKAEIRFQNKNYEQKDYTYLSLSLQDAELPDDVYDIVIDAGHGGRDQGEKSGVDTEANITLEYAKLLKENLENSGFKVYLTRNDENTDLYNATNMYDSAGRITTACKSRAKLMLSFHINNGVDNLNGLEIYSPCKSNLDFAKSMASKIVETTNLNYSNNHSFKMQDGVYVRNFTPAIIKEYENTAKKKGYEPYTITTDTPYLYTIREVGGIATNAYVDGRNKDYSENVFCHANYGIECYQIELGYIKNDLETIKNEKEAIISAITTAVTQW